MRTHFRLRTVLLAVALGLIGALGTAGRAHAQAANIAPNDPVSIRAGGGGPLEAAIRNNTNAPLHINDLVISGLPPDVTIDATPLFSLLTGPLAPGETHTSSIIAILIGLAVPPGSYNVGIELLGGFGTTDMDSVGRATFKLEVLEPFASLGGQVKLQGLRQMDRELAFEFRTASGRFTRNVVPGADGDYVIGDLPPGDYELAVEGGVWLRSTRRITLRPGELLPYDVALLTGDIVDDNTVDFADFERFLNTFGLNDDDPAFDFAADLNDDGTCDFADFELFLSNFGTNGDG